MSNSAALRGYGARNSAAVAGYAVLQAPVEPVRPVEPARRGHYRPPRPWIRVPEQLVWRATLILRFVRPETAPKPAKTAPKRHLRRTAQKCAQAAKIRLKMRQGRRYAPKTALKIIQNDARPLKTLLRVRLGRAEAPKTHLTVREAREWAAELALTRLYGLSTLELVCLLAADPDE